VELLTWPSGDRDGPELIPGVPSHPLPKGEIPFPSPFSGNVNEPERRRLVEGLSRFAEEELVCRNTGLPVPGAAGVVVGYAGERADVRTAGATACWTGTSPGPTWKEDGKVLVSQRSSGIVFYQDKWEETVRRGRW
jgi:hypothetical protein